MAVDLFANAANTTLTAALTAGATSLTVTSSTPFPAVTTVAATQFRVIIDAELFIVTNVTGLTWTVTPGAEGTTQAAHANGATVTAVITAAALTTKVTAAQAAAAAPVQSVAGRAGAVVLALADVPGAINAAGAPVQTVAGRTGAVVLTSADISGIATGQTVTTKTIAYTAVAGDYVLANGTFTVTIPVLTTTQRVSVKNIGAGTVTIAATSGTVDGAATVVLSTQYTARDLVGDGTNLWVA